MHFNETDFTISPFHASSKAYQLALRDELLIGGMVSLEDIARNRINQTAILNYKSRILGGKREAIEYADWTDFLVDDYSKRKSCLSLGSGLGRVEEYLIKKGFAEFFETIEICATVNSKLRVANCNIEVRSGDLNFISLPTNKYDFILCHGVLHHLINLEHVLQQINNSLTDNGILLIYEYVGETRWQFSKQRMDVLRNLFPNVQFKVPPRWSVPGFESVRSGDLLPLIHYLFGAECDISRSYGGIYFPFVICTDGSYDNLLDQVVKLDDEMSCEGNIAPCYHMGIYHKSTGKKFDNVIPWSKPDALLALAPPRPLKEQIRRALRNSKAGNLLSRIKQRISQ